jgi:hypothetical protein
MMRFHSMTKITLVVAALGVGSQASATVNLVTNGSFETGDFSGWTQSGTPLSSGVIQHFAGFDPTDGDYQAYFSELGSLGGISQSLATVAGGNYSISFDLANLGGTPSEYFVQFGSTVLAQEVDPSDFPYTRFSFTVTAASNSSNLSFSIQQDPSWMLLDNISVTAVPEPGEWAMLMTGIPLVCWQIRRKQANGARAQA